MAPERSITPEKQLLKLIQAHRGKDEVALQAHAIRYRSLSMLSFGAWLGRFSFSLDWLRKKFQGVKGQSLDIKLINKVSLFFIYVLAFYFLLNLISSAINLRKVPNLDIKSPEGVRALSFTENSVLKDAASFYLEKVRGRDIFKIGAKKTTTANEENTAKAPTSRIIEATANLKLVGISWSHDPDALIEDSKALRTFFVKVGQMIGEVKVQAIFKDRVILRYGVEEIEIR